MADVYIVLFSLIGILLSLPALLIALSLLAPRLTGRVTVRLQQTPGQSFILGVPVASAFLLWIAISANIPIGAVKATGFLAGLAGLGLWAVGAAGMARLLGDRLAPGDAAGTTGWLARGAVVYELACLFPVVGWFLFLPLAAVTLLGAATFALIGWLPRERAQAAATPETQGAAG